MKKELRNGQSELADKLAINLKSEEEARMELKCFAEKWDSQYPSISKSWQANWENLITLFDYPDEIHRIIYLTIEQASRKWSMPIGGWKPA